MISDFDIHVESGRLVVRMVLLDGSICGHIYDVRSKEIIGYIDPRYMPQGPRFAADGSQISFFSDGTIYVYDTASESPQPVFQTPGLHASFCEWSPSSDALVFNAYPVPFNKNHPPDIFILNLRDSAVTQLTDSENVDRFPQWSPTGRHIAFLRQNTQETGQPKHICVVDLMNGETNDCSPNPSASYEFGRHCWSPNADHLLALERFNGQTSIIVIDVRGRKVIKRLHESDTLGGISWLDSSRIVIGQMKRLEILSLDKVESNLRLDSSGTSINNGSR